MTRRLREIVERHGGARAINEAAAENGRLEELVDLAQRVKNISAKHEGGLPEVEGSRPHPSEHGPPERR